MSASQDDKDKINEINKDDADYVHNVQDVVI